MNLLGHSISAEATGHPFLIAGPGLIASETQCLAVALALRRLADRTGALVVFAAGFGPLSRRRGKGLDEGLRVLERVRAETGLPVLIDVHQPAQVAAVVQVADMLQVLAHPAGRAGLITAAAASGRPVNLRKAHSMSMAGMAQVVNQARATACAAGHPDDSFTVCERGTLLSPENVVVDMRGLIQLRDTGCPVVFDATHGMRVPGVQDGSLGTQPAFVAPLARAAVAVGVAGLLLETHAGADHAQSDNAQASGRDAVSLAQLPDLAEALLRLADGAALAATPVREPLFAWHRRKPAVVD